MHKIIFIISLISFACISCDDHENIITTDAYISSLNDSVLKEYNKGAEWTLSPERITKHFFPAVMNETHPVYIVKIKSNSNVEVTVNEDGPYDDEVIAEQRVLSFQLKEKVWTIIDLKHKIRRRT